MKVSSLKEALENRIKTLRVNQRLMEMKAIEAWDTMVGPNLSRQTKAIKITDNKLFVVVTNSVWVHQLTYFKRDYVQKINQYLSGSPIKDIVFFVGDVRRDHRLEHEDTQTIEIHPEPVRLTQKEEDRIKQIAQPVESEEVRKAFEHFMGKDLIYKKAKKSKGWGSCRICGSISPPGQDICQFCQESQLTEQERRLTQILKETPWIALKDAQRSVFALERETFEKVKEKVKSVLLSELNNRKNIKNPEFIHKAMTLTMLETGLTPDLLDSQRIRACIGDENWQSLFGG